METIKLLANTRQDESPALREGSAVIEIHAVACDCDIRCFFLEQLQSVRVRVDDRDAVKVELTLQNARVSSERRDLVPVVCDV